MAVVVNLWCLNVLEKDKDTPYSPLCRYGFSYPGSLQVVYSSVHVSDLFSIQTTHHDFQCPESDLWSMWFNNAKVMLYNNTLVYTKYFPLRNDALDQDLLNNLLVSYRHVRNISFTSALTNLEKMTTDTKPPLQFELFYECRTTKARCGRMTLVHHHVNTPVFMPVGTQGTLKGLLPQQLEELNCQIILGNTYHLGTRPGLDVMRKAGGLHNFMNWKRALLTDSGGFQMVSLLELAKITEEGVKFKSPYNESDCMLTPEHSIHIQNIIGADIMMQLDDVVKSTLTGPRVEEAMHRTTRWLDRCLSAHQRPEEQSIFPIVQGGLDPKLRSECAHQLIKRNVNGYAVGGLSGGESKDDFWRMVDLSTNILPKNKPRYLMGVGFASDLIICTALGIDMFDCVFPTRTARFGCALVRTGQLNLKQIQYSKDFRPIDESCECNTCKTHTRAYLHHIVTVETVACHLLSIHNIAFQMRLMKDIRESIKEQRFPEFIQQFMLNLYPDKQYPSWIVSALEAVNVILL